MDKREVRSEVLRQREEMPANRVEALSGMVQKNVEALPEYRKADVVASYVAKGHEVQTSELLKDMLALGKKVIVPRSHPETNRLTFHEIRSLGDLAPGKYGVLEPSGNAKQVALSRASLILVPVVAWDSHGGRLGYGKGYFDRELRSREKAVAAGLAFESQRRPTLPLTSSDVLLDVIVTEERTIRFGRQTHA